MKIAVDVCIGDRGARRLQQAGHVLIRAQHGEPDEQWLERLVEHQQSTGKYGHRALLAAESWRGDDRPLTLWLVEVGQPKTSRVLADGRTITMKLTYESVGYFPQAPTMRWTVENDRGAWEGWTRFDGRYKYIAYSTSGWQPEGFLTEEEASKWADRRAREQARARTLYRVVPLA